MSHHLGVVYKKTQHFVDDQDNEIISSPKEVSRYNVVRLLDLEDDPLLWWKTNALNYQRLPKIANNYFFITHVRFRQFLKPVCEPKAPIF